MTDMHPPTLRALIRTELETVKAAIGACSRAIQILEEVPDGGQVVHEIIQQITRIRNEKHEIRAYLEGLDLRIDALATGLGRGKPDTRNDFALALCFTHEYQTPN